MNVLELDVCKMLDFPEEEYNLFLEKVILLLKEQQSLIITSCLNKETLKKVMAYAEKKDIVVGVKMK